MFLVQALGILRLTERLMSTLGETARMIVRQPLALTASSMSGVTVQRWRWFWSSWRLSRHGITRALMKYDESTAFAASSWFCDAGCERSAGVRGWFAEKLENAVFQALIFTLMDFNETPGFGEIPGVFVCVLPCISRVISLSSWAVLM